MKMKRILSLVLCLCMMASVFSMSAFADEYDPFADLMQQIEQAQLEAQKKLIEDAQKQAEQQLQDILDQLLPDEPEQPEEPEEDKEEDKKPAEGNGFTASLNKYSGEYAPGKNHLPDIYLTVLDESGKDIRSLFHTVREEYMINAGTYSIEVVGNEGTDYEGQSVTLYYTVTPAPVYVSASNASKYTGQRDPVFTYTSSNNAVPLSGRMSREWGEYIGKYAITQGSLESADPNYYVVFENGTLSILASSRLEKVCYLISRLPDRLDPGNEFKRELVLNVWVAYLNLSEVEKMNVPPVLYEKLYNLVGSSDYAITAGSGGYWYEGKSSGLSFVAIDPYAKFAGLRIDGELIDMDNYNYYHDADNETAVVTLKASYLKTLSEGKHSITFCFWNGSCSGYFYVLDKASAPPTGDTANLPLWSGMMLLSCIGIAAAGIVLKRKKAED
ncbi:MAG: hypothetical protein IJE09_00505 [Oscillospiraceae bacterium]|nr:hypothetical protein [Oscillospiraceae bacterium]